MELWGLWRGNYLLASLKEGIGKYYQVPGMYHSGAVP